MLERIGVFVTVLERALFPEGFYRRPVGVIRARLRERLDIFYLLDSMFKIYGREFC